MVFVAAAVDDQVIVRQVEHTAGKMIGNALLIHHQTVCLQNRSAVLLHASGGIAHDAYA